MQKIIEKTVNITSMVMWLAMAAVAGGLALLGLAAFVSLLMAIKSLDVVSILLSCLTMVAGPALASGLFNVISAYTDKMQEEKENKRMQYFEEKRKNSPFQKRLEELAEERKKSKTA
jgi:hypothetical protein